VAASEAVRGRRRRDRTPTGAPTRTPTDNDPGRDLQQYR